VRDVLALIGFQGMVNEIVLGILDPLHLDGTYKVETFHPLCSCTSILSYDRASRPMTILGKAGVLPAQ
jgi:hypothetical protein